MSSVNDDVLLSAYEDDLESGQLPQNYRYDNIGNLIYDQQEEIENISWNVSGKIVSLTRIVGSQKADLEFEYDAMGNRIVKRVIPKNPDGTKNMTAIKTTYYVRDAQSNIMASYTQTNTQEIALEEMPIYGSSRIGVYRPTSEIGIVRGTRVYEGTNHLGNVLVTFSDRIVFENGNLKPAINSYSDFYAFGMPIKTRTNAARLYKFGFNGQIKDDEIYGEGNAYSAQYWEYDARLGRRWNIDPVTYPWQSSYSCFNSNPILYADPLGLYGEKRAKRMAERAKKQGYDVSEIKKYGSGKRDYGFTMTKEKSDGSGMYGAQKIGGSLKSIENDNYFTSYDEIKVYSFLNEGSEQKHQLNWWSRNSPIIKDYAEKTFDFPTHDFFDVAVDVLDDQKITNQLGKIMVFYEV